MRDDKQEPRSTAQRLESLGESIVEAVDKMEVFAEALTSKVSQTQTIIHRNEGMGAWGSAAVVACFLTYLSLIIFAVWSIFQINNLTAWKDVYGRDLAAMKQQVTTLKQEKAP